jgi:hypothetical protein
MALRVTNSTRERKKRGSNFLVNTTKKGFLHRDRKNNDFSLSAVGKKDTSRESKKEESIAYTTTLWIKFSN